jgi:hypothetical protein
MQLLAAQALMPAFEKARKARSPAVARRNKAAMRADAIERATADRMASFQLTHHRAEAGSPRTVSSRASPMITSSDSSGQTLQSSSLQTNSSGIQAPSLGAGYVDPDVWLESMPHPDHSKGFTTARTSHWAPLELERAQLQDTGYLREDAHALARCDAPMERANSKRAENDTGYIQEDATAAPQLCGMEGPHADQFFMHKRQEGFGYLQEDVGITLRRHTGTGSFNGTDVPSSALDHRMDLGCIQEEFSRESSEKSDTRRQVNDASASAAGILPSIQVISSTSPEPAPDPGTLGLPPLMRHDGSHLALTDRRHSVASPTPAATAAVKSAGDSHATNLLMTREKTNAPSPAKPQKGAAGDAHGDVVKGIAVFMETSLENQVLESLS